MYKASLVLLAFCTVSTTANGQFPDAHDQVPGGWGGNIFRLSQRYPLVLASEPAAPWLTIDPITQPETYARALFKYAMEGNVEVDFNVQDNKTRAWYHVPWMHFGNRGREFIHGLTRERTTPRPAQPGKGELGPQQVSCFQNWAVSFFNARGGYQVGQVWRFPSNPDASSAVFPEGTMVAKLLFTTATESEVPYLKGAFEWEADIHDLPTSDVDCRFEGARRPQKVRLLQVDLAVKDKRAPVTGWVFATMSYDGLKSGNDWLERMEPVGVQWGNDPGLVGGQPPRESWINPNMKTPQHLGYQGRLNGPVDNPRSACMSCHATAQVPARSPMVPPNGSTPAEISRWFQNYRGDTSFDARSTSTDYSLQLAMGIQNFQIWSSLMGGAFAPPPMPVAKPPMDLPIAVFHPGSSFSVVGDRQMVDLKGELVYRVGRE